MLSYDINFEVWEISDDDDGALAEFKFATQSEYLADKIAGLLFDSTPAEFQVSYLIYSLEKGKSHAAYMSRFTTDPSAKIKQMAAYVEKERKL